MKNKPKHSGHCRIYNNPKIVVNNTVNVDCGSMENDRITNKPVDSKESQDKAAERSELQTKTESEDKTAEEIKKYWILSSKLSLTNVSLALSAGVLILTSLKAFSYSLSFHIPMHELMSITNISEYVVLSLPFFLLITFLILATKEMNGYASNIKASIIQRIWEYCLVICYSVLLTILMVANYLICWVSIQNKAGLLDKVNATINNLNFLFVVMWVAEAVALLSLYAYDNKVRCIKSGIESSFDYIYVFSMCIIVVINLLIVVIPVYSSIFTPLSRLDYETVLTDAHGQCVVICDNSNGKIIMAYSQNYNNDRSITIDNSQYWYITPSDCDFEYQHFDEVRIEPDNG